MLRSRERRPEPDVEINRTHPRDTFHSTALARPISFQTCPRDAQARDRTSKRTCVSRRAWSSVKGETEEYSYPPARVADHDPCWHSWPSRPSPTTGRRGCLAGLETIWIGAAEIAGRRGRKSAQWERKMEGEDGGGLGQEKATGSLPQGERPEAGPRECLLAPAHQYPHPRT